MAVTHGSVFGVACLLVLVQGNIHQHIEKAGSHCGNFTGLGSENKLVEAEHYHCVECLYSQNCLAENQCKAGTRGDTCEKCVKDFHRVGHTCMKCPSLPWAAMSFGVYFLISIGAIFYHGLTDSVCTKMKLLSHFLQNVLLTLHISIAWPEHLLEILSIVNFGKFNSDILYPDCLFSSWPTLGAHYLEWITSLCIPILTIILGKFLDASMKKMLNIKDSQKSKNSAEHGQHASQKRTTVRRLVVMVMVIMYMPATLSCIRTFLCSDTIPKLLVLDHTANVFLLDNDATCETFTFQNNDSDGKNVTSGNLQKYFGLLVVFIYGHKCKTIHFFATVYLVFFGLLFPPMLIFFTLRQKKWNLLCSQWILYGPVYESYKEKYCFWEAIPLLRKLIGIIITEAYPVSAFIQTCIQLGMSGVYLLALVVFRPYRSCYWVHPSLNVHIFFEVVSNLAVCLLQAFALTVILDWYQQSLDLVAGGCVFVVVVIWIVLMIALISESKSHIDLPHVDAPESSSSWQSQPQRQKKGCFQLCKKTKIEPDPKFVEKVKANRAKIDF